MRTFETFDGLKLAYSDTGDAQALPLLCLAGLTRNSQDFSYLAKHLPDVRMICMDYRGRGQSEWAKDPQTYSIPAETRDALALLDHLGLDKVALLGTSRGGLIGMTMALVARERLRGVCLNDIGPELAPTGLTRIMDYLGEPPNYATAADMARDKPNTMIGFSDVTADRWAQEVAHQTRQGENGLENNYDPALRDAVIKASTGAPIDLWPLFDALHALPTALIRGANSDLLSSDTAREMQARHKAMMFAQVPNRGHVPFLDERESVQGIRKWLDQCR